MAALAALPEHGQRATARGVEQVFVDGVAVKPATVHRRRAIVVGARPRAFQVAGEPVCDGKADGRLVCADRCR